MAKETTGIRGAKALIRRVNEEVWQAGKLDLIDEAVAEGYVEHNTASPEPIRGPDGYKGNVEMVHGAFSDIEATGKEVTFAGMGIARVADGRLREAWSMVDVAGLMQQLGAGPG